MLHQLLTEIRMVGKIYITVIAIGLAAFILAGYLGWLPS